MNKKSIILMGSGASSSLLGFCILHMGNDYLFIGIAGLLFVIGSFNLALGISTVLKDFRKTQQESEERILHSLDAVSSIPQHLNSFTEQTKQSLDEIIKQNDKVLTDVNTEFKSIIDRINKYAEDISESLKDNLQKSVTSIEACKNEIVTQVPSTTQKTAEIIIRTFDEVTNQLSTEISSLKDSIEDLIDDIGTKFSGMSRTVRDSMSGVSDELLSHENEIKTCIETLATQYKEFERMNESIIEQMTLMSKNDLKVLKGLING